VSRGAAAGRSTVIAVPEPDLAEALELRDELLVACREVLLTVGTRHAASLVASIDALLDLDDEASPGSSPS
jgi:hypothetical protein